MPLLFKEIFRPGKAMILALVILTCCLGCADQPAIRARYQAERELFLVEKDFAALRISPQTNTPEQVHKIRLEYRELVAHCQEARQSLASIADAEHNADLQQLNDISYRASIRLSQFYFGDRQYDSAATVLEPFVTTIPVALPDRIVAAYNVGRSYQSAAQWTHAADAFRTMYDLYVQAYPQIDSAVQHHATLFEEALRVLVTFAEMSKEFNITDPFSMDESVTFYQKMIQINPASQLALLSRAHIARLYEVAANWPLAIMALKEVVDSTGQTSLSAQLRIADLEAAELGRFDDAIAHYAQLEPALTGDDTLLIPEIHYRKIAATINKKDYDNAAKQLVLLERDYPAYYNTKPAAQQAKARLFEIGGNRERAESEYRFLIEKYPNSGEAMSTFLHLAEVATASNDTASANDWYERAERHYEQAAARGTGTVLEALAMNFKAELYRQKADWPRAATALEEIYHRFPTEQLGRESMAKAASIYALKMNDSSKANLLIEQLRRAMSPVDDGH